MTRGETDIKYVQRSRVASKRAGFMQTAGWRWLQMNRPDVARSIRAQAEKLFPLLRRTPKNNYTFLEKVKP